MKIILGIFCGLMLLFAGGCALILLIGLGSGNGPLPIPAVLITAGVGVLNLLVLVTLFGTASKHVWAFYVLGVADLVVIAILVALWFGVGFRDSGVNTIGTILVGGLALKALLTFIAARKV